MVTHVTHSISALSPRELSQAKEKISKRLPKGRSICSVGDCFKRGYTVAMEHACGKVFCAKHLHDHHLECLVKKDLSSHEKVARSASEFFSYRPSDTVF